MGRRISIPVRLAHVIASVCLLVPSGRARGQSPPPPDQTQPPPAPDQGGATAQTPSDPDLQEDAGEATTAPSPPPPPPPAGLLPLAEPARLDHTPPETARTPFHGGRLLLVSETGLVEGLAADTTVPLWKLGLPGERFLGVTILAEAPFDLLLSTTNGHLIAINGETGEIRWEHRLERTLGVSPLLLGPDRLALATSDGEILAYRLESRAIEFKIATEEPPRALATNGELLVVSGGGQSLHAIDIGNGTLRWSFKARGPFTAPATFDETGERLYVGDESGDFYCLSADQGKVRFRWSSGAAIRSAAFLDQGRVYVATYGNTLFAYNAGNGHEQWRTHLPGRPASEPMVVNLRLIVATIDGMLVEVNPANGKIGARHQVPGEILGPPSFFVAQPTEEEILAAEQATQGIAGEDEGEEIEPTNAPTVETELAFLQPSPQSAPPESTLLAPETGETVLGGTPLDNQALPPPGQASAEGSVKVEPRWFERSRIALTLRSGEVLVLRHQPPEPPPPPPPAPGNQPSDPNSTRQPDPLRPPER